MLNTYINTENSVESCYMNNGLRLICEYRNSFTTTIGCFVPAGAMYEMPEERGSVLFLEHLLFKVRKKYNKTYNTCDKQNDIFLFRFLFIFY